MVVCTVGPVLETAIGHHTAIAGRGVTISVKSGQPGDPATSPKQRRRAAAALEIPIPAGMSDEDVRSLREEIALHLSRTGFLTVREAAKWLSLSYQEFYELAARRGCIEIGYDSQAANCELARLAEMRS